MVTSSMQWQVLDYSSNEKKVFNLWSGMGDWEYGNVSHDHKAELQPS